MSYYFIKWFRYLIIFKELLFVFHLNKYNKQDILKYLTKSNFIANNQIT